MVKLNEVGNETFDKMTTEEKVPVRMGLPAGIAKRPANIILPIEKLVELYEQKLTEGKISEESMEPTEFYESDEINKTTDLIASISMQKQQEKKSPTRKSSLKLRNMPSVKLIEPVVLPDPSKTVISPLKTENVFIPISTACKVLPRLPSEDLSIKSAKEDADLLNKTLEIVLAGDSILDFDVIFEQYPKKEKKKTPKKKKKKKKKEPPVVSTESVEEEEINIFPFASEQEGEEVLLDKARLFLRRKVPKVDVSIQCLSKLSTEVKDTKSKISQKFERQEEEERKRKEKPIKRGTFKSHSFTNLVQKTLKKPFYYGLLLGTMHQGHESYPGNSRNEQDIFMPIAAYCYAALKHPNFWSQTTIDDVLDVGNDMYLEALKNKHWHGSGSPPIIIPDDLPKACHFGTTFSEMRKIAFKVDEPFLSGKLRSNDKRVYNITKGLNLFFERCKSGILQMKDVNIALWKDKFFYFFDALPRNTDLYRDEKGSAGLALFYSITQIVSVLLDRSEFENLDFVIRRIILKKILEPDEEVEPKPKLPEGGDEPSSRHYIRPNEQLYILMGSYDLGDKCFGSARNKQALPMAMVALVYTRISPPLDWDKDQLDRIMVIGNQLYLNIITDEENLDVTMEDLPAVFTIGPYIAEVFIQQKISLGLMYNKGQWEFYIGIKDFFVKNTMGLVEIAQCTVAIWRQRGFFFCFDPYPRGQTGSFNPTGVACVSVHSTARSLSKVISQNFDKEISPVFYIHALKVCKIRRDKSQHDLLHANKTMRDYSICELKKKKMNVGSKSATNKDVTINPQTKATKTFMDILKSSASIVVIDSNVVSLKSSEVPSILNKNISIHKPLNKLKTSQVVIDLDSPSLSETQVKPPKPPEQDEEEEIKLMDLDAYDLTQEEKELQGGAEEEGLPEREGEEEEKGSSKESAKDEETQEEEMGEEDMEAESWYAAVANYSSFGSASLKRCSSKISKQINTDITCIPLRKVVMQAEREVTKEPVPLSDLLLENKIRLDQSTSPSKSRAAIAEISNRSIGPLDRTLPLAHGTADDRKQKPVHSGLDQTIRKAEASILAEDKKKVQLPASTDKILVDAEPSLTLPEKTTKINAEPDINIDHSIKKIMDVVAPLTNLNKAAKDVVLANNINELKVLMPILIEISKMMKNVRSDYPKKDRKAIFTALMDTSARDISMNKGATLASLPEGMQTSKLMDTSKPPDISLGLSPAALDKSVLGGEIKDDIGKHVTVPEIPMQGKLDLEGTINKIKSLLPKIHDVDTLKKDTSLNHTIKEIKLLLPELNDIIKIINSNGEYLKETLIEPKHLLAYRELAKESNFVDVIDDSQVISGTTSTRLYTTNVDAAGAAICFESVMISHRFALPSWNPRVIDAILQSGFALHQEKNLDFDKIDALQLGKIQLNDIFYFASMKKIFSTTFTETNMGKWMSRMVRENWQDSVVVTPKYCFAIMIRNNIFYIFDPYENDESGFATGVENQGCACLVRFKKIIQASERIAFNYRKRYRIPLTHEVPCQMFHCTIVRVPKATMDTTTYAENIENGASYICFQSIIASKRSPPNKWNEQVISDILKTGMEYYQKLHSPLQKMTELNLGEIQINGKPQSACATFFSDDTVTYENMLQHLNKMLFINKIRDAMIITPIYCCAIMYRGYYFFLFDPYENDTSGFGTGQSDKQYAYLGKFETANKLTEQIIDNLTKREKIKNIIVDKFNMFSCKIQPISKTAAVAAAPISAPADKSEEEEEEEAAIVSKDAEQVEDLADYITEEEVIEEEIIEESGDVKADFIKERAEKHEILKIEGTTGITYPPEDLTVTILSTDYFICLAASLMSLIVPFRDWSGETLNKIIDIGTDIASNVPPHNIRDTLYLQRITIEQFVINIISEAEYLSIENLVRKKTITAVFQTLNGACFVLSRRKNSPNCDLFTPYTKSALSENACWMRMPQNRVGKIIQSQFVDLTYCHTLKFSQIEQIPRPVHKTLEQKKKKNKDKAKRVAVEQNEDPSWLDVDPFIWTRRFKRTKKRLEEFWNCEIENEMYSLYSSDIVETVSNFRDVLGLYIYVLAISNIFTPEKWNRATMDNFATKGIEFAQRKMKSCHKAEKFPTSLEHGNHKINFTMKNSSLTAIMFLPMENALNLSRLLRTFFNERHSERGIAITLERDDPQAVVFGRYDKDEYFFYDAQTKGAPIFPDGEGGPYAFRTTSINRLLNVMTIILRGGVIGIIGFELNSIQQLKPSEEAEEEENLDLEQGFYE